MTAREPDPKRFYGERVPAQFNRTLEAQRRQSEEAGEGSDAASVLHAMTAVNASILVVIREQGEERYALDVERGVMSPAAAPGREPFMTLVHDLESFRVLERESGDSILAFLGAIAGLGDEMRLTTRRVENLCAIAGTIRFERSGEDAFSLLAHFGFTPLAESPAATISLDAATYGELERGELEPQDAFLSGRVEVGGDLQVAIQLALAALAPD
ncbi:MAG: SCP2 sterol-binding domain-containing protein [Deltaproteobacteria bacterium]|nr:SCP2 sterol-binding domain-containing protein [Deltaproteobacteria bacterium]MBW2419793.1 SCP2 sterol-binding domain-containing protein [Deltaproteobacteria bacterium]